MPPVTMKTPQLNKARLAAKKMMVDTCNILAISKSTNQTALPGVTPTWNTQSTVSCRLDVMPRGNEADSQALNMFVGIVTFYLPYDTTITPENRISHNGHTYEIKMLADDLIPLIYKQVNAIRIDSTHD